MLFPGRGYGQEWQGDGSLQSYLYEQRELSTPTRVRLVV